MPTTRKKRNFHYPLLPYLMISPAMLILFVFVIYPIFYMIYLSFFNWNMISDMQFTGIQNYLNLIQDGDFLQVAKNSFIYVFFTVSISIIFGLFIALYLKSNTRINTFLQSAVFVPHIVSLVSISFIWMWLMDSDYGLLNFILEKIGLRSIAWLENPDIAMTSIILISVWKCIGYNTIILLSAIQAVPEYLYQAANLDKASALTTFFKITLPMISPSMFFLILINMISAFKVFEPIFIITKGGPLNSTNTFVHMIYEYGFKFYKIGYASSIGVVLMVILGVCTVVYFRCLDKYVHYQ